MKIAIISVIRDPWGGSEEIWYDMAKVALGKQYTVMHLAYEHPDMHFKKLELISKGLISYERPGYIRPKSNSISFFFQLVINFMRKKIKNPFNFLLKHKPDIVIYNGSCFSIAKEKQLLNIISQISTRFYIIAHLVNERVREFSENDCSLIKKAYELANKKFFVANRLKEVTERQISSSIKNSYVIKNPINIEDLSPLPYPSGVIQFALVGNIITAHKGQDIVIDCLSTDKWQSREWHLNIYGSGFDEDYLKKLIDFKGLSKRVTLHGRVKDIRKVWIINHILLMPSHMEGMPLAVVEAMICARACITTDVGGILEWIDHDVNGFVADAATVNSYGKVLEYTWTKKNQWEVMGKAAHEKAISIYDPTPGESLLKLVEN